MANDLSKVIPQLLAQGLMALREMTPMALLVNRGFDPLAGPEGSTIDVPIPSAIAVQDVVPAATPPATADITPTSVPIPLNRWKEAPFHLSDKELLEIQSGTIPMIASEAVRALANEINAFLLGLAAKFFGVFGTSGTTPFGDEKTTDASGSRTILNNQLAPLDTRYAVLDPFAEGSALDVRAFHDASFGVGGGAILEGQITRRLGFGWFMSQLVQTHTAGTGLDYLINNGGGYAIGIKTITVDTGSGTILVGDIIKFSGHTQTYVVTSALSGASLSFEPGLVAAVADSEVITGPGDTGGVGTHVMNMMFQRDAIAFATRPLEKSSITNSSRIETAFDAQSGLTLRLEITREHKRDRWSFDVLYGAEVIRRELGMRLLG